MKKLKIGIIGTGGIGTTHMDSYQKCDKVEVTAVCDINEERVKAFAEKYGVQKYYKNYQEMLDKEELDGVSVCTWNDTHAEISIAALKAGKNVLCEKPMAMNAKQGEQMLKTAKETGKLLMIGFVRRFGINADIAKEYINHGELGDIYYAKTQCVRRAGNPCGWFADKKRSGGGPLIDLGVHMIDLSRYLMGKPKAVAVSGMTSSGIGSRMNIKGINRYLARDTNSDCDVEDFATAFVRFDNGAVLHVEVSFSAHIKEDVLSLDLQGLKGGMKIEPKLEFYSEKYDYLTDVTPVFQEPNNVFNAIFEREVAHFAECILTGCECRNPAEDGLELMKILDAVYESAKCGKEVIL